MNFLNPLIVKSGIKGKNRKISWSASVRRTQDTKIEVLNLQLSFDRGIHLFVIPGETSLVVRNARNEYALLAISLSKTPWPNSHSSFPVIHKVGNVVIFVLLRREG